jgi:peptide/nickel transport system ATP-binding protein/oligopeptide transport system ATP-binding protein
MKELQERLGMAVIWITHDLGVVAGIADRVVVMYGGQIVEQAPTRELFKHPQHPYTRALLKTVPRVLGQREDRLEVIEGQPPILGASPTACPFLDRCDVAFDRCAQQNPQRYDVGNDHDAACFYDARTGEPRDV